MTMLVVKDDVHGRRRRIYFATWKFRIGQGVEFGEMTAIVLSRSRTTMGMELYSLLICGPCYGRPLRVALGRALKEKPASAAG